MTSYRSWLALVRDLVCTCAASSDAPLAIAAVVLLQFLSVASAWPPKKVEASVDCVMAESDDEGGVIPVARPEDTEAAELAAEVAKLERIAEFHLEASPKDVMEALWGSAEFYAKVLDGEEPKVGEWHNGSRRVDTRHPLNVPVPRWCGLRGFAIPTIKLQRKAGLVVRERSSFAGFPMSNSLAVETAWVCSPVDQGTLVEVRFKLDFEPIMPTWLRPIIITKSRAELLVVNRRTVDVARDLVLAAKPIKWRTQRSLDELSFDETGSDYLDDDGDEPSS
ncbi:hypothetical protein CTAYLR_003362 [Chrysophaeum taylorii]|uniref:VASt domain-containing protein n=1 Tax=Chrysophaeum taylorii TaxID=2483200 RepID=A0AAD7UGJ4_9STRA|nr:hypothetical protein CTAYLR_003362 [Chrysophaeum taylorii]